MKQKVFIHPTAIVSPKARIGAGTRIWAFAQIREGVVIGKNCVIGNGAYLDTGVRLGNRVNVHNKALLYRNLTVEDDAFIGPGACFVNDPVPRANRIRDMRGRNRKVGRGASIGANTTVMADVPIGKYALIGAASLVSEDIPDHALAYGAPARLKGFVSPSGRRLEEWKRSPGKVILREPGSRFSLAVDEELYEQIHS